MEEFAVALKCERDPDMEASAVLLARLGACLAKDLTGASKTGIQGRGKGVADNSGGQGGHSGHG